MFEPVDGWLLVILVALFVLSQVAVAWELRNQAPRELSWPMFALGPLVAPFLGVIPAVLVVVWICMNLATLARSTLRA